MKIQIIVYICRAFLKHIFCNFQNLITMTIRNLILTVLFTLPQFYSLNAQSPVDLTSDVVLTAGCMCSTFPPGAYFSTETQVINAFNLGRRAEEIQLLLPANSLGNLTLPSGYSSWNPTARALYILNSERTARIGTSRGLPLEGVEANLTTIAQNHTKDMITNNFFAHTSPTTMMSPYDRINNSATYGPAGACREFMSYAENLYVFCNSSTTTPTYTIEQALFGWIYQDAGSGWGHRRAALIQNANIYGATGFTNNVGSAASEGYLGIGIGTRVYPVGGPSYSVCGTLNAHIFTMNIADPKPTCSGYVLPVELLNFVGVYKDTYIHLTWTTASEKNNSYFIVERSGNGKEFKKFSVLNGAGASQSKIEYNLDDITPLQGVNYYRLVQVDYDGMQAYSPIIAVNTDKKTLISVYPNPTSGVVYIATKDNAEEQIDIINQLGEIVYRTTVYGSTTLNLSNLNAGIYVLRTGNGYIQRIAKL